MPCRHSGNIDNPRIRGTFNEPMDDWSSFYTFTYFIDSDGKYQLKSLAESGFDPSAHTRSACIRDCTIGLIRFA